MLASLLVVPFIQKYLFCFHNALLLGSPHCIKFFFYPLDFILNTSLTKGSKLPYLLTTPPPNFGDPPIFRIMLTSPNFMAFQLFSNCIQKHYFNLYKTLLRTSDEGYRGVVVLCTRQD